MIEPFTTMRRTRTIGPVGDLGRTRRVDPLPSAPRAPGRLDTTPEDVIYWLTRVSRERAMAAYRLKKRGIDGTLPELLTYDWLERRRRDFDFQSSLMGGRLIMGGAVADFLINDLVPGGLVVWRVQGDYWHTLPEREAADFYQREQLLMQSYLGVPIAMVVDLWESTIYKDAPRVFEMAEAGVEIGKRML